MVNGILFNVTYRSYLTRSSGIYRIAHFLREHGADIEVVDWANHWQLIELQELFKSRYNSNLKFIGFSHMFSIWDDMLEDFCAWIKTQYPHVKIISGSPLKPWFESKYIDFYVMGFGEHAALELVKYISGNGTRPNFSLELANGKPLIDANANYTAYPMRSLMIRYEDRDFLNPHEWLSIETARGCKFKCDFCNFPVLGVKGDYTRDAEDFELQLRDAYDRFGITGYVIGDETFNDRTEKITKFADVVEKLSFAPQFSGYIRADLLHSRKLDLPELSRMNFFGHYYGVESFNTASARLVGKGLDSEKIKQTLIDTKQYYKTHGKPYRGTISLIIGLPHETNETLNQAMTWLSNNWQEQSFMAYSLSIPVSKRAKSSLISKNFDKYGYRELTNTEFKSKSSVDPDNKELISILKNTDSLAWKNQNMDVFEAFKIEKQFIKLKEIHDFRYGNFALAYRSRINSLEDRLNATSEQFKQSLVSDLSQYIKSKLNWIPK